MAKVYREVTDQIRDEWAALTPEEYGYAVVLLANKNMPVPSPAPQMIIYGGFPGTQEGLEMATLLGTNMEEHFKTKLGYCLPFQIVAAGWQQAQALCAKLSDHQNADARASITDRILKQFKADCAASIAGMEARRAADLDMNERIKQGHTYSDDDLKARVAVDMKLMREKPAWEQESQMLHQGAEIAKASETNTVNALEALKQIVMAKHKSKDRKNLSESDVILPVDMLPTNQRFVNISSVVSNDTSGECVYWLHSFHETEEAATAHAEKIAPRFAENIKIRTVQLNRKINLYDLNDPRCEGKVKKSYANKTVQDLADAYSDSNAKSSSLSKHTIAGAKAAAAATGPK